MCDPDAMHAGRRDRMRVWIFGSDFYRDLVHGEVSEPHGMCHQPMMVKGY